MSYETHGIFYILVNFAFNLPNYVTTYMHYSGKKKIRLRKICFQGIRTRTLQSIFSKKSIFNAALCRFKYFDWARAEHPNNTCGRVSAALPHILHVTPPWVVPVFTPHTTGPCVRCTVWNLKLIVLKCFSLPFTQFEPCGAVFNMNSKEHLRKNICKDFQPLCLWHSNFPFLYSSVSCCRHCLRCAKRCSLCSAISCWRLLLRCSHWISSRRSRSKGISVENLTRRGIAATCCAAVVCHLYGKLLVIHRL